MMKPNDIKAELVRRGIVKRTEARAMGISPTVFNDVINMRIVSTRVQEHLARLINRTPEKVFGHMYRPEKSRLHRKQTAA